MSWWMLPLAVARWRVEQGQCRCRRLAELSVEPPTTPPPAPPNILAPPAAPLTSANGHTSPAASAKETIEPNSCGVLGIWKLCHSTQYCVDYLQSKGSD